MRATLLVVGASLAIAVACDSGEVATSGPMDSELPDLTQPRANVLLLVVDALRTDVLTPYGAPAFATPTLSRLADEGVVFEQCRASSPWTLPSMGSILTGLYPRSHGAGLSGLERCVNRRDSGPYGPAAPIPDEGSHANSLAEGVSTLATAFSAGGYATYLRATNPYYTYGLSDGYDSIMRGGSTAHNVVYWALEQLKEHDAAQPFFMTLHFIDVHTAKLHVRDMGEDMALYEEPGRPALGTEFRNWALYEDEAELYEPPLADRFRMYQACTHYVDRQIDRLLKAVEQLDLGDTYVVFTADHGEDFRDHWDVDHASGHTDPRREWKNSLGVGHGHNLHNALTHVPLLISGPNIPGGLRLPDTVSLVDIMPTLCELVGLPVPVGIDGMSLVRRMAGGADETRARISESMAYGREKTAYFSPDGYVLIQPRSEHERPQLFHRPTDPLEQHDLIEEQPERAQGLLEDLKRWEATLELRVGERHINDAQALERLRDLGYVGDE